MTRFLCSMVSLLAGCASVPCIVAHGTPVAPNPTVVDIAATPATVDACARRLASASPRWGVDGSVLGEAGMLLIPIGPTDGYWRTDVHRVAAQAAAYESELVLRASASDRGVRLEVLEQRANVVAGPRNRQGSFVAVAPTGELGPALGRFLAACAADSSASPSEYLLLSAPIFPQRCR